MHPRVYLKSEERERERGRGRCTPPLPEEARCGEQVESVTTKAQGGSPTRLLLERRKTPDRESANLRREVR